MAACRWSAGSRCSAHSHATIDQPRNMDGRGRSRSFRNEGVRAMVLLPRWVAAVILVSLIGLLPHPAAGSGHFSGNWSGVWGSSRVSQGGIFVVSISQSGSALLGTAALQGSPCFGALQIAGVSFGDSFNFVGASGGITRVSIFGVLVGNTLRGTYAVIPSGTACDTDWGTVNAARW